MKTKYAAFAAALALAFALTGCSADRNNNNADHPSAGVGADPDSRNSMGVNDDRNDPDQNDGSRSRMGESRRPSGLRKTR